VYAGGNPINNLDPSGRSYTATEAVSAGVRMTLNSMAVIRFLAMGVTVFGTACFLDWVGTNVLRELGYEVGPLTPCGLDKDGPRVTLYRGVNSKHPAYGLALAGIAKPGLMVWEIWKHASTPEEHSTLHGATLNSFFTSWSLNFLVAENYALRDQVIKGTLSNGVVLKKDVLVSRTIPMPPKLWQIVHPVTGQEFPEEEVLVRGVVRGAKVIMVP
jgi:hypothetical protein